MSGYSIFLRLRRVARFKNLLRIVIATVISAAIISLYGPRLYPRLTQAALLAEDMIWKNCLSLETLRNAEECFEDIDILRRPPSEQRRIGNLKDHIISDDPEWVSAYGLVLDYDISFNGTSHWVPNVDSYTTKRKLKCLIGFSMSIVWSVEFQVPILEVFQTGLHSLNPNRTKPAMLSCPRPSHESSTALSILINCGFDIKKDPWGHPLTEDDHADVETCTKMAYSWVKGRLPISDVDPWANLCKETGDGNLRCPKGVFQVGGSV